ncbi:helix-turn-helix transcriptional regulator [Nonomuraea sp. NPDC000554]|uniref:helix-turn-helix domain-containing protein n=1 Tax=Nonomuraea sp. NPDC000554 TaxID=3154259 RepID=UPI003328EA1B
MADAHALMVKLGERRMNLGLTQLEVASRIGVSQGAVSFWETGQRTPNLAKFTELADLLGVELTLTLKKP